VVLQQPLPVAGHADLCAGYRPVVLVHGPVHRAAGAGRPNEKVARRGSIFASFLKLFPPYLFIIPGMICFALVKSGKVPELSANFDARTPSRCW